jgi:hypothetical protein
MGSPRTVWLAGPVVAMVAVRRAPTTSPLGHILSVLDEDGGLVVEGMFDPEHISALRRAVLGRAFGHGAARDAAPGTATQGIRRGDLAEFVGRNTVRFSSLGSLAPDAFFGMLRTPLFRAVADAMLLPYCGSYWLNTGQAMLIGPQSEAQELHRDADNWPEVTERLWPQCPELTVSCMIALEAVSRDIGATRIVPGSVSRAGPEQEPWSMEQGPWSQSHTHRMLQHTGSSTPHLTHTESWWRAGPYAQHRWEDQTRAATAAEALPAELAPGDALLYSGKVLHGGGANTSATRWRHAVHLSFVVG